jgi:hypothetical protein
VSRRHGELSTSARGGRRFARHPDCGHPARRHEDSLDQTLAEAAHELHGQYATSVSDYEAIRTHILMMADQFSTGIVAQFPSRFR